MTSGSSPWKANAARLAQRYVDRIYHHVPKLRPEHRRILFGAHNSLAASYLREVWDLLKEDERLSFRVILRRPEWSPGDATRIRAMLPVPAIKQSLANFLPWDLVIVADHLSPFAAFGRPSCHPVLRIHHGIGGKRYAGKDYFYGPKSRNSRGELVYSRFFESSESRMRQAISDEPDLTGKIQVVGIRRADLVTSIDPTDARRRLGLDPQRPVVLVASSWGEGSLFFRFADELISAARFLAGSYQFVFRPHPNLYSEQFSGGRDWLQFLRGARDHGIHISGPEAAITEVLAASVAVVVDDLSSVALLSAAAGRSVVLTESGSPIVRESPLVDQLRRIVPVMRSTHELPHLLARVLQSWPPPGLPELLNQINSEPGRSAELMRRGIYELLHLQPQRVAHERHAADRGSHVAAAPAREQDHGALSTQLPP